MTRAPHSEKSPGLGKAIERDLQVGARICCTFLYQLSLLMTQGVGIVNALTVLAKQQDDKAMSTVAVELAHRLERGQSLSMAMLHYPRVFDATAVALIRIGERTGALDRCLNVLASWKLKEQDRREYFRSATLYPIGIISLASLLTLILFRVVLPPLLNLLLELKAPLPWPTRLIMLVSHLLCQSWFWLASLGAASLAYWAWRELKKDPERMAVLEGTLRNVPVLGALIGLQSSLRYVAALELLFTCGVDTLTAIPCAAEASGSQLVSSDHKRLIRMVTNGSQLSDGLRVYDNIYHPMIAIFLSVGEESATVPKLLQACARQLDEELNHRLDLALASLEPLLLLLIGTVVGGVLVSVFLPLYACLNRF